MAPVPVRVGKEAMMKHGWIGLALMCWMAATTFAADLSIPASAGMQREGLMALSLQELEAIEGGDLYLSVDRDSQMMTVTRVTPGDYSNVESYSVKVTTSVVQNKETASGVAKGVMENPTRQVKSGDDNVLLKQFPTGTANLSPTAGPGKGVEGPVIRTDATQQVTVVVNKVAVTTKADAGYNIHYVDPEKSTNTLGCIGVQSESGMAKLVSTLNRDTASYKPGESVKQTVSVSAYTNNTPAAPAAFQPAPKPVVAAKPSPPAKSFPSVASVTKSKPWWKFW